MPASRFLKIVQETGQNSGRLTTSLGIAQRLTQTLSNTESANDLAQHCSAFDSNAEQYRARSSTGISLGDAKGMLNASFGAFQLSASCFNATSRATPSFTVAATLPWFIVWFTRTRTHCHSSCSWKLTHCYPSPTFLWLSRGEHFPAFSSSAVPVSKRRTILNLFFFLI